MASLRHKGSARRTSDRRGSIVSRGAVVRHYDSHGESTKGIVLRLLPWNTFSRAYGRQALVAFYGRGGRVYERSVGVGDLQVIGRARHVPRSGMVLIPPSAEEIARHERIRDIRRQGQGAYYNPTAPHNVAFESPPPGHEERRVLRRGRRS